MKTEILKPIAKDSQNVRELLKASGINLPVNKYGWSINIGRQTQMINPSIANQVLAIADNNNLLVVQRNIVEQLIQKGICDTISLQVLA